MHWQPKQMPSLPHNWPRIWQRHYRLWWHNWLLGDALSRTLMTGDWRQP